MQRMIAAGSVVLLIALLLSGCAGWPAPSGAAVVSDGTVRVPLLSDPGTLDPDQSIRADAAAIDAFGYDSLVYEDSSGRIVSGIASKWTVDTRSVTFTLRTDVTCSDGARLKASDVKANFDYVKDLGTAAGLMTMPDSDFTVLADDARGTVTISRSEPYPFLVVGAGALQIVCPRGMADRSRLEHGIDGTGPYTLTEDVPGDHIGLRRRAGYRWGPDGAGAEAAGMPLQVVFPVLPNETAVTNMLLSRDRTAAPLGPAEARRASGRATLFRLTQAASPTDLFFNQAPGRPGSDRAVRKALTMALDLTQVRRTAPDATQPTGLVTREPQVCPGNTVRDSLPAHDGAAAEKLLDETGWRRGPDRVRSMGGKQLAVVLDYPSSGGDVLNAAMEIVARSWQAIGVPTTVRPLSDNALSRTLFTAGDWDVASLGMGIALPVELIPLVSGAPPPAGTNFASIDNRRYSELVQRAQLMPGKAGCGLWNDAERALFSSVDIVPWATSSVSWYGHGCQFRVGASGIEPTSVRLLAV
jgi:peptide/nickel transport system substrate-binding protein